MTWLFLVPLAIFAVVFLLWPQIEASGYAKYTRQTVENATSTHINDTADRHIEFADGLKWWQWAREPNRAEEWRRNERTGNLVPRAVFDEMWDAVHARETGRKL